MKKILLLIIILVFSYSTCYALTESDISAECACVIESKTGKVLFDKNKDMRHAMASTTKIMTGIIALEEADADEIVTMSITASKTEGSSIYLEPGEKIYMRDLVYGLMLNSGNDAAVAIAEHISGTPAEFCRKMNEKADELGLSDTNFKNPNGLYEEGHFTTAHDLARLTQYAMKSKEFREIVSTKEKKIILAEPARELYFSNHNKLLWDYNGAIGVKTGYTTDTGRCLVSAAEKNGTTLYCVTLDAPGDWSDHTKMLDYCFSKLESRVIIEQGQVLKSVRVGEKLYDFVASSDSLISYAKGTTARTLVNLKLPKKISGPFEKGEKIGVAEVIFGGEILDTVDIIASEDVPKDTNTEYYSWQNQGFFEKLWDNILKFFLYA